jgi:hypothetical protein
VALADSPHGRVLASQHVETECSPDGAAASTAPECSRP